MPHSDLTRSRMSPERDVGPLPQSCPSCTSATIVTTDKVPTIESYWRCLGCGEIWTPARRATQGFGRRRP